MIVDGHVFLGETIYMEQSPETIIANMDRLGVDVSVVVAPPPGPFYGKANDHVLNAVERYSGRLAALYRANPLLEGEEDRFREALERGFAGLQLDPTHDGYGVTTEMLDPVVEAAGDASVPVYVHSGDSIFCPPEYVADLAGRFQKVNFVTSSSRRAHRAVQDCGNVYILSNPFPTLAFQHGRADHIDLDRLVFASDAPLSVLDIELKGLELSDLGEEARDKITGGNLKRILPLP